MSCFWYILNFTTKSLCDIIKLELMFNTIDIYKKGSFMDSVKDLLELFQGDCCNYDTCRQLIAKIGGCTQIIEGKYGSKSTPLHEAIEYGHYDFSLELIKEPGADLEIEPNNDGPIIWDLQYLWAEAEEEQWKESENKLRIIRALIEAGANPNPKGDSEEELLSWIRYKIGENEGTAPEKNHLWQMEHIIDAHANGDINSFKNRLNNKAIDYIMLSKWGFYLIDYDLCVCDHAVFVFENGDKMLLSSYMVGDEEWDFYATHFDDNPIKYEVVKANSGNMKLYALYNDENYPTTHLLDIVIDDAILRIRAEDPNIIVGIVGLAENDYHYRKRKTLFKNEE